MEINNRILTSLPAASRKKLPPMQRVTLEKGAILSEPDREIDYVYFPDDALVSILSSNTDGSTLEIGLIGRDGVVGVNGILGGVAPYRAVVQKNGAATRMRRRHVNEEFCRNYPFQILLLRYTNAFLIQVAQYCVCNSYHSLEERICRWLLFACDRVGSDTLPITHELLARLLGVRRASVTVTTGRLQKSGLVLARRGEITVIDRVRLKKLSCECYFVLQAALAVF